MEGYLCHTNSLEVLFAKVKSFVHFVQAGMQGKQAVYWAQRAHTEGRTVGCLGYGGVESMKSGGVSFEGRSGGRVGRVAGLPCTGVEKGQAGRRGGAGEWGGRPGLKRCVISKWGGIFGRV